jgi:carbamate kinase
MRLLVAPGEHVPAGKMGSSMASAIEFVSNGGRAIIRSLDNAVKPLAVTTGTIMPPEIERGAHPWSGADKTAARAAR